jgi:hypothetical protein
MNVITVKRLLASRESGLVRIWLGFIGVVLTPTFSESAASFGEFFYVYLAPLPTCHDSHVTFYDCFLINIRFRRFMILP